MQHDEKKKQKDIQLHPIFVINLRTHVNMKRRLGI